MIVGSNMKDGSALAVCYIDLYFPLDEELSHLWKEMKHPGLLINPQINKINRLFMFLYNVRMPEIGIS